MTTTRSASEIPLRRQETPNPAPPNGRKPLGAAETTVYEVDESAESLAVENEEDEDYWEDDEDTDKNLAQDLDAAPDDADFEDFDEPEPPQTTQTATQATQPNPIPHLASLNATISHANTIHNINNPQPATNSTSLATHVLPVLTRPQTNPTPTLEPAPLIPPFGVTFASNTLQQCSRDLHKTERRARNFAVVLHQIKMNIFPSDLRALLEIRAQPLSANDESAELYQSLNREEAALLLDCARNILRRRGEVHELAYKYLLEHIKTYTAHDKLVASLRKFALKNGERNLRPAVENAIITKIETDVDAEAEKYLAKVVDHEKEITLKHNIYLAMVAKKAAREAAQAQQLTNAQRTVPITNYFGRVDTQEENNRAAKSARHSRNDTPNPHRNPNPQQHGSPNNTANRSRPNPMQGQRQATDNTASIHQDLAQRLEALERQQQRPPRATPRAQTHQAPQQQEEEPYEEPQQNFHTQANPHMTYHAPPAQRRQHAPQAPMQLQDGGYWAPNQDGSMHTYQPWPPNANGSSSSQQAAAYHTHNNINNNTNNNNTGAPNTNPRPNVSFQTPKRRNN